MPAITELFNKEKAINIVLKGQIAPMPIRDMVFGKAKSVDSDVLPARYWTKTLKAIPTCSGTTGAEPMSKTDISLINYDFGSFFAKTDFTAQEQLNFEKMSGASGQAEISRLIQDDGLVSKDLYDENMCASAMSGKLSIKTRVNADGTFSTYDITYGTVSTTARAGASWATASKSAIYKDLKKSHKAIETQMKRTISKREVINFASETAFQDLFEICEKTQTNDNVAVKYGTDAAGYDFIELNGYRVYDIAGEVIDAEDQSSSNTVADNYIQAVYIGKGAGHGIFNLKIPNRKADFRPLPMIVFAVEKDNGKGFTTYFEGKPCTVFNVAASTKMLVIS